MLRELAQEMTKRPKKKKKKCVAKYADCVHWGVASHINQLESWTHWTMYQGGSKGNWAGLVV